MSESSLSGRIETTERARIEQARRDRHQGYSDGFRGARKRRSTSAYLTSYRRGREARANLNTDDEGTAA